MKTTTVEFLLKWADYLEGMQEYEESQKAEELAAALASGEATEKDAIRYMYL